MPSFYQFTFAFLALGTILLCLGSSQPVYTDPDAPARLSLELADLPREQRFSQWHSELHRYETNHKRFTDLGRGFIALGIGVALANAVTSLYRHFEGRSRTVFFAIAWIALWALKIPFLTRYYTLRLERFDFPTWGDSIAIPISTETVFSVVCCVLTGGLAAVLMIHRSFDSDLILTRPTGTTQGIRAALMALWFTLLFICAASGVWYGNEGSVITCVAAYPLLLAITTAPPDDTPEPPPPNPAVS